METLNQELGSKQNHISLFIILFASWICNSVTYLHFLYKIRCNQADVCLFCSHPHLDLRKLLRAHYTKIYLLGVCTATVYCVASIVFILKTVVLLNLCSCLSIIVPLFTSSVLI